MSPHVCVALAALALAACATSPPARFFTLSGPPPPTAPSSTLSIVVGPVAIPAVVDRPEIVVSVGNNEVWLDEFNRWASPLADAIAVATAENLGATLGTARATSLGQSTAVDAEYRVSVDVQRFESVPGQEALLEAFWTVTPPTGEPRAGRWTVRVPVTGPGYDALVAAHGVALERLGEELAAQIRGRRTAS